MLIIHVGSGDVLSRNVSFTTAVSLKCEKDIFRVSSIAVKNELKNKQSYQAMLKNVHVHLHLYWVKQVFLTPK